ncbi:PAS domain-containing protein [Kordiimonas marina]|uniref:PAS domain-containing protein n=1 Tax=Kordiimonas marina TaxID=2872312 RepID=UPI001FF5F289|nr:PAS domain-containing protein [Kordiimonas marina]MCJ9429721.1 PAS domain-containing protein [Kordiimonas marina]
MKTASIDDLCFDDAATTMYDYWLSLPRPEGQVCPKRSDFDFDQVKEIDGSIYLSEWVSEDVLAVARCGDDINKFIGADLTGINMLQISIGETQERETAYYHLLRQTPCAGVLCRGSVDIKGQRARYFVLHLPLLDYANRPHYLIGVGRVFDFDGPGSYAANRINDAVVLERKLVDIGAGLPPGFEPSQKSVA